MCSVSLRAISIESPTDMLTNCIENKLRSDGKKLVISESKSSTESESDSRFKFSFSSDCVALSLTNQEILQMLEGSDTKNKKLQVLGVILQSQFDSSTYYWDILRILQEYLNEDDYEVFQITLEIHEKCIKSSWESLKDAFINLLETLYVYYFSLDAEIYADRYPFRNAFVIYKLILWTLNEVFLHVPNIGQLRLEKVIGNFIDLVFFSTKINDENLIPLNIISSMDPTASWCKTMLHNVTTREILFKCMKRNKNVVECVFHIISDWMCNSFVPTSVEISYDVMRYATFLSCIHCCSYFSKYSSFYDQFPVLIESKFVISLRSFTTSVISFLKLRTRYTPKSIIQCMVECTVNLLQFLSSDSLVLDLQYIIETLNTGKQVRKYLLEVVRRLLDERIILDKIMNVQMYAKSRISPNGNLLRPRFYSSSSTNIFLSLMNTAVSIIRNENRSVVAQILSIVKNIFQCHELYLICGPDSYLLAEFVELLGSKCERKKLTNSGQSGTITHVVRENDYLFAIGSTPMGYYYLSKTESLFKIVLSRLEKSEMTWLFPPLKNPVPFLITSEQKINMRNYYRKICGEVLELICQVIEYDCTNEYEIRNCFEKILIFVDILSHNVNGIFSLMNSGKSENAETEVNSFAQFIKNYALVPTYGYKVQYIALKSLQTMIKNFNVRVYLLCFFNYEECLHKIQKTNLTDDGKLIKDEFSILRAEILASGSFCSDGNCLNRLKAAPKAKLSRKKLSDIETFLQKTRHGPYDNSWLKHARKFYKNSLTNDIRSSVMTELIEKSAKSATKTSRIIKLSPLKATDFPTLRPEEYKGIFLAVRYGLNNRILNENSTNEENLALVVRTMKGFIGYQESDNIVEFDCVLATIFIICEGIVEKSLNIVSCMLSLPVSILIWPRITPTCTKKRYLFGHLLEWILFREVPSVFSSLLRYGISWWLICKCEMDNCFWNTMTWMDICNWLCITVLNPPDNLIYYFTSVAFKNATRILQTTNEYDLRNVLHGVFGSHRLEEHLHYMECLSKKYHLYLSPFLAD